LLAWQSTGVKASFLTPENVFTEHGHPYFSSPSLTKRHESWTQFIVSFGLGLKETHRDLTMAPQQ
jgi:hypothetical protein